MTVVTATKPLSQTLVPAADSRDPEPLRLDLALGGAPVPAYLAGAGMAAYAAVRRRAAGLLTPAEQKGFQGLAASYRQAGFLLGLYAAKRAAAAFLKEPALGRIEIARGVPDFHYLRHASPERPEICLSNTSREAVALAFPQGCVLGIDIDSTGPDRTGIYRRQMSPAEAGMALSEDLIGGEAGVLAMLSTAKEALARALRLGPADLWQAGAIESLAVHRDSATVAHFAQFPQYLCRSWILGRNALSIVMPRTSEFRLDTGAVARLLAA